VIVEEERGGKGLAPLSGEQVFTIHDPQILRLIAYGFHDNLAIPLSVTGKNIYFDR